VVPIINENDTVVTDEIELGDNDTLGALVDQPDRGRRCWSSSPTSAGLYTADPRRDPRRGCVREAQAGDPALEAMAGGAGSGIGTRRHAHQGAGGAPRGAAAAPTR
jgi:glutamate 5-kinase